ncbi:Peptidoglycan/LPS O-acetylase OafA/YrhL, contains acyltransferase and SGNH-hydrolase domains [Quadrisphaera granulorum]|uniref:Peptidoglycan/LPS O-acetylase OafA/YrhL n=1 Tax=Quadrisphaera granulorum TaxID=317664 RepID=A0A316ABG2_9ACTN|nr:acyltransferase [Quadrisphaera granulorum]PWJ55116.1 peptidoglycan/LPS O-acetylase OafA/YrhL [Quadrisphaera granulorum]SZE95625.1 Peptidoglycan/LPS O-acetylase OafA/YrhL, contains acyltransferase and SGNH-hydrolase domains [Quadrisphaera granulorum]
MNPAGRTPRLPALDGLRGLAALVVVLFHAAVIVPSLGRPYGPDPAPGTPWVLAQTPLHVLWSGEEAVYVFFVLSGFVLALPLVNGARPALRTWVVYYPRRLVRLYLPVAASLVLALLAVTLVPRTVHEGASWWLNGHAEPVTAAGLVKDLTLVAGNTWLNSPLWSLRWEVLFSLALPAYVLFARITRRVWWLAAGLLALATAAFAHLDVQALFYLSMFAIGAVAAVHSEALRQRVESWGRVGWITVAVVAVALLEVTYLAPQVHLTKFAGLVAAVGVFLLFLGAGPVVRFGASRPVAWLGKISFSLYLVHVPVLVSIGQVATMLGAPAAAALAVVVGLPLSLLLAAGFHRVCESPSHRLSLRAGRAVGDLYDRFLHRPLVLPETPQLTWADRDMTPPAPRSERPDAQPVAARLATRPLTPPRGVPAVLAQRGPAPQTGPIVPPHPHPQAQHHPAPATSVSSAGEPVTSDTA